MALSSMIAVRYQNILKSQLKPDPTDPSIQRVMSFFFVAFILDMILFAIALVMIFRYVKDVSHQILLIIGSLFIPFFSPILIAYFYTK